MHTLKLSEITAISGFGLAVASSAFAQSSQVKPPQAQAWIDVATFSGLGMPAGMSGGNPMAMMGSLLGGGVKNTFGNTRPPAPGVGWT